MDEIKQQEKEQQETKLQEKQQQDNGQPARQHRHHHRHHHHRDPRKRFKYPDDEYTVNDLLSPLPRFAMQAAVALVGVAALFVLFVNAYGATGKELLFGEPLLGWGRILKAVGECTLLSCFLWGMYVWHYCPRWLFAGTIATGFVWNIVCALSHFGNATAATYSTTLLWLYSILALILISEILMTFTGAIIRTFLVFTLYIAANLVKQYAPDEVFYWIALAAYTGLSVVFAYMLYQHLQPRNTKKNIMKV